MWSSRKKKEKQRQVTDLTNKLKALENKHIERKDSILLEQISLTKLELNKIFDNQVENKLKYIKQRYYENGPRAKKILAWRLRKQQSER